MGIRVVAVEFHTLPMRTRIPFRYGIAELTSLPHLVVTAHCEIDGQAAAGQSADGLPPKWFTKNPAESYADDLRGMLRVISSAATLATELGTRATVFDWWSGFYAVQKQAMGEQTPPLLWNFGVSLIERAVIDAFCRRNALPFARALRTNALGVRLEEIHPELTGALPADLLSPQPRTRQIIRHTVGLSDPLTPSDIAAGERASDGLPQSLDEVIQRYGVDHFKIKLCGVLGVDQERLRRLKDVIETALSSTDYAFTLDGNEQFATVEAFRDSWRALSSDPKLAGFFGHLIFVEQPIHRDFALAEATGRALRAWTDRPPTIIDESDATVFSLPTALSYGYVGTSHKNCKGVFKGVCNTCLIAHRRRTDPAGLYEMSSEDLSNVGPVALTQDIAVSASLGIEHLERNGHHYFRGLSMWPKDVQEATLAAHKDLYERHSDGLVAVRVARGQIDVASVVAAPFGTPSWIDRSHLDPLDFVTFVESWDVDPAA